LFKIDMVTPIFLLSFFAGSTAVTILTRLAMRYMLTWLRRRRRNLRHLLIVGTNSRAIQFAINIESRPELGYAIIGFVDADWKGYDKFKKTGRRLVADLNGFTEFILNNVVDEVLISLPLKSHYEKIYSIVNICENQGILIRHLPQFFDTEFSRLKMKDFEDEPFISQHTDSTEGWQVLVKAVLDRVISLILLLFFLPLFITIGILIKITSQGPVFFVQDRIGLNKRLFRLFKFRTMIEDAEQKQIKLEDLNEVDGAAFKIKNDPRVTKIGRFLRKTSIDELPQLINVLKGDMSLVGPRPLPVRDYNRFNEDWYRRRFSVRPGITCLWQVNGRHKIPFKKWMELDL
jgi:exopolysaccharide biosynthesis polyprenyl glycosylphosphotransferase